MVHRYNLIFLTIALIIQPVYAMNTSSAEQNSSPAIKLSEPAPSQIRALAPAITERQSAADVAAGIAAIGYIVAASTALHVLVVNSQ